MITFKWDVHTPNITVLFVLRRFIVLPLDVSTSYSWCVTCSKNSYSLYISTSKNPQVSTGKMYHQFHINVHFLPCKVKMEDQVQKIRLIIKTSKRRGKNKMRKFQKKSGRQKQEFYSDGHHFTIAKCRLGLTSFNATRNNNYHPKPSLIKKQTEIKLYTPTNNGLPNANITVTST